MWTAVLDLLARVARDVGAPWSRIGRICLLWAVRDGDTGASARTAMASGGCVLSVATGRRHEIRCLAPADARYRALSAAAIGRGVAAHSRS